MNYFEKRPWGSFENILVEDYCKVKKIIVNVDESLSYQFHSKRMEVWVVVKGNGQVTLNDKIIKIKENDVIQIPKLAKHNISNTGDIPLIFIEVQTGEYFGEDDIIRIEDKYGRE